VGESGTVTIKWVKSDPLVMNGEPFCYGSRLTVRQLLEMREHGLRPREILTQQPELRWVGIAEAYRFAAEHRARYADFFEGDRLVGPGYSAEEAASLPEHLRKLRGVVADPS
jgi:uncharacterized protein (DUF433 family)